MMEFLTYIGIINGLSYGVMWVDKVKSIYKWWRIRESTLWIFACLGGVFGIWLGMQKPLYHKAAKKEFRFFIPVLALFWIALISYLIR